MKVVNGLVFTAVSALALASLQSIASAGSPAGTWSASPTFFDDFNGTTLDTAKWSKGYRWADVINNEMQGFVPENVAVGGGNCTIKVEKRTVQNTDWVGYKGASKSYASGAIQTYNKWTQAYGYFEVRAKLPSGKGTWPAFWMLPDRGASVTNLDRRVAIGKSYGGVAITPGNEIDIFEIMGSWKNTSGISKTHSGYFWKYKSDTDPVGGAWGGYGLVNNGAGPGVYPLPNPDTEYHVYGCAWGAGQLDFYVDGVKVLTQEEPPSMTNIGYAPHYMVLNAALKTDDWTGTPVPVSQMDAGLPSYMVIDYVKAWSGTPNPTPPQIAPGTYRITPKSSSTLSVQVAGAGTADSDNVNLGTYTGATNQQWNVSYLGGAVYEIKAVHSGKALNVAGGSGADNTNVDQFTDSGTKGQRWKAKQAGTTGYFRMTPLVNTNSGLSSYGTTGGANVYSTYYSGANGQLWKFEPVGSGASS